MPKAKWGCLLEDAETDVCVSSVGVYEYSNQVQHLNRMLRVPLNGRGIISTMDTKQTAVNSVHDHQSNC